MKHELKRMVRSPGRPVWSLMAGVLLAAAIAALLFLASSSNMRIQAQINQATRETSRLAVVAMDLLQALGAAEIATRDFLMSGGAADLRRYQDARREVAEISDRLQRQPHASPRRERVEQLVRSRLAEDDRIVGLIRAGRADEARAWLQAPQSQQSMQVLRQALMDLNSEAQQTLTELRRQRDRTAARVRLLQLGLALSIGVAFVIAVGALALERAGARKTVALHARLNKEINDARQRAEEANRAKSRFLATASHDMRQPLHALSLYIATLKRRVPEGEATDILRNMDEAVQTMSRLFNALLDLARLEAGVLKPEPIGFPLDELLEHVASSTVDPRDLGRVRVIPSGLLVWSDPDLLEIVLRNLTHNAVKHSAGGQVLLGARRRGETVRVEVHDTGPGIAPDQVRKLFGEFVQGERPGAGGVGLGLSIVERMCRLLGHELVVHSTPGRGSVFAVVARRVRAGVGSGATPVGAALTGARILVADDEPLALDAMRRAFEDAGATVATASCAGEVLDRGRERFDLYVFDLDFGGDDGLALLDRIAALRRERICSLIVTGATSAEALGRLREARQAWLTKPVAASTLTAAAAALLEGASSQAA